MLATRTSRWTALTALVCLGLVAVTWLFLVSPRRAEAAEIRESTAAARSANDALELQIAQLKAQFAELPQKKAELAAVYAQLPAGAAMPDLVRSLDQAARSSSVVLKEVTPGSASLMAASAPVAGVAAPGAAATGAAATGTAATGTAATGTAATGTAATGTPAPGAAAASGPRVVVIPVTVAVEGGYFQTVNFLKKLQTEIPRAFLVTSLQVTNPENESAVAGTVSVSISGKIFALPDAASSTASSGSASSGSGSSGSRFIRIRFIRISNTVRPGSDQRDGDVMSQVPTIGRFGQDAGQETRGVPEQAGAPDQEQNAAETAGRRLGPVQVAAMAAAGILVAGGVAWVLLGGGSSDPADPGSARPVAPAAGSPTASALELASTEPGGAAVANRNPFGGASSASGAAASGSGAAAASTPTVTQRVTATVSVPVVSTVTTTVRSTSTVTSTVTAEPVYVYAEQWSSTSGTLIVNADQVAISAGDTLNGVTVTDTDGADQCLLVKVAGAADSTRKQICEGESVELD